MAQARSAAGAAIQADLETRFWALFEQTHDAVFLIDLDLTIVAANERAARLLDYQVSELIGMPMSRLTAPGEVGAMEGRARELVAGGEPPVYERTMVRRGGEPVWVEVNAALVRDTAGEPLYLQSIARDITARRRHEEALRLLVEGVSHATGEDLLRSLVRALARSLEVRCAMVAERIPDEPSRARALAFWSGDAFREGYSYELAGSPCEGVLRGEACFVPTGACAMFPEDAGLVTAQLDSYFGLPLRDSAGKCFGILSVADLRPMDPDLESSWLLQVFAARAAGELERLQAQSALEASERRHRRLVESIPVVVYEAELEEGVPDSFVSPGIEQLTGYTPAEWTQPPSRWLSAIHPHDRGRVLAALKRTRLEGVPFHCEYRLRTKDGREIWARDDAAVIGRDERRLLQGVMVDITAERHVEQQALDALKLDSLGLLAGGVAHDFNNLLMTTLGNLSLAKLELPPDGAGFARLAEAEKALLRAKGLTQQLLAFAKGGAPVRRPGQIRDLIRDTASFAASGSNVVVQLAVAADLRPAAVDADQIGQVVENLVLNAVQAMPNGGTVRVEASNVLLPEPRHGELAELALDPGWHVRCSVRDHGVGIDPEDLPRIFDPYFTTKKGGSGLGLATSYAIVRRHNGNITAVSEPGRGTEVTFYLPALALPATAEEPAPPSPSAPAQTTSPRVLLMDDDTAVREVVALMLSQLGYQVTAAASGEEAVEAYRRALGLGQRFDAVIMDLTVAGGLGGREATARLLELDPDARVVVSSGYSGDPVLADHRGHGFVARLPKPYVSEDLERILREVLLGAVEKGTAAP
jgi:PAS domain S-box-containing protein